MRGKFHRVVIVILFSRAGFSQVTRWRGWCVEGRPECDCFVCVCVSCSAVCFLLNIFTFQDCILGSPDDCAEEITNTCTQLHTHIIYTCVYNKLNYVHRPRTHTIIHANDNIIIHPIRSAICSRRRLYLLILRCRMVVFVVVFFVHCVFYGGTLTVISMSVLVRMR